MPEPSQIVQCLVDSESLLPLIAFPVTVVAIMCVWATHCSPSPIEVKGFVPELPVWPDTTKKIISEFSVCLDVTLEVIPEVSVYPHMAMEAIPKFPVCPNFVTVQGT